MNQKLSLTWKIFLVVNYSRAIIFGFFILLGLVSVITSGKPAPTGMYLSMVLVALTVLISIFNIGVIKRFFPDKNLPQLASSLLIAAIIVSILLALVYLLVGGLGIYNLIPEEPDILDQAAVLFLMMLWLLECYSLILQFKFKRYLRKNSEQSLLSLIDSIGKNEP